MSKSTSSTAPAPSVEQIEKALEARRRHLSSDLEALGARLAPEALKTQVKQSTKGVVTEARQGFRSALASVRETAERARSQGGGDPATPVPIGPDAQAGSRPAPPPAPPGADEPPVVRDAAPTGQSPDASSPGPAPQSLGPVERLIRVLDDARDGDPTSLAVVTATVAALAGISVVALVKAVRS